MSLHRSSSISHVSSVQTKFIKEDKFCAFVQKLLLYCCTLKELSANLRRHTVSMSSFQLLIITGCSTSSYSFQLYLSPFLENFQILELNINLLISFDYNGIWIGNKLFDAIQVIWLQFSSCNRSPFYIWISSANI